MRELLPTRSILLPLNLLGMAGMRSTASPYLPAVGDAVERVPTRFKGARREFVQRVLSLGLSCVCFCPDAIGQAAAKAGLPDAAAAKYLGDHPELILSQARPGANWAGMSRRTHRGRLACRCRLARRPTPRASATTPTAPSKCCWTVSTPASTPKWASSPAAGRQRHLPRLRGRRAALSTAASCGRPTRRSPFTLTSPGRRNCASKRTTPATASPATWPTGSMRG